MGEILQLFASSPMPLSSDSVDAVRFKDPLFAAAAVLMDALRGLLGGECWQEVGVLSGVAQARGVGENGVFRKVETPAEDTAAVLTLGILHCVVVTFASIRDVVILFTNIEVTEVVDTGGRFSIFEGRSQAPKSTHGGPTNLPGLSIEVSALGDKNEAPVPENNCKFKLKKKREYYKN